MAQAPYSRWYPVYVHTVSIIGLGGLVLFLPGSMPQDMLTYCLLVALGVLSRLVVYRERRSGIHVSMSFIAVGPAIYLYGAVPGAALAVISYIGGSLLFDPAPTSRILNSAGMHSIMTLASGFAYSYVTNAMSPSTALGMPLAVAAMIVTMVTVNHLMVNLRTYLASGPSAIRWKQVLKWDLASYVINVPMALVLTAVIQSFGVTGIVVAFAFMLCALWLFKTMEHTERTRSELAVYYENALQMSSQLDGKVIFDTLVRSIGKVVDAWVVAVYLATEEEDEIRLAYVHPDDAGYPTQSIRAGEGSIGQAVRDRKPLHIQNAHAEGHLFGGTGPKPALGSALIVPLVAAGKVTGVVVVANCSPGAYTARDLSAVSILAEQASVSFHNARAFERAEQLARTDPMTGLHNYRHFVACLGHEIDKAQLTGGSVALLYMDIDGLKDFNNTYGHLAGDEVLRDIALLLRSVLRRGDIVARYGGDEFVMLLPGGSLADAESAAERIRDSLSGWLPSSARIPGRWISVSIGAASYPEDAACATTLVSVADERMYEEKRKRKEQRQKVSSAS